LFSNGFENNFLMKRRANYARINSMLHTLYQRHSARDQFSHEKKKTIMCLVNERESLTVIITTGSILQGSTRLRVP